MKGLFAGLLVAAVVACDGTVHAFSDSDCSNIVAGSYQVSEDIRDSEPLFAARQRAHQQIIELAVANVIGVRVKSNRSSNTKADNDRIEDRFRQIVMARSQGLVRYEVSDETVAQRSGRNILEIKATATVCVPNKSAIKDVIVIKEALSSRNEPLEEFRSALIQELNASSFFTVAPTADGFEDADVSARVVEVDVRDIEARSDSMTGGAENDTMRKFKRIRVVITAEAKYGDEDAIRVTVDEFRNVPTDRDSLDAINLFVPAQLQRAAKMLVEKMAARRGDGPSFQAKPSDDQRAKPKW